MLPVGLISTRRDFTKLAVAQLAFAALAEARGTKYKGVRLGVGTYSFRGVSMDDVIKIVSGAGLRGIELEASGLEPQPASPEMSRTPEWRNTLRQWRISGKSIDDARGLKKKLDRAGIEVYAYTLPINDSFSDAEIDQTFTMTKALGSPALNTLATMTTAKRLVPFADKHKLKIGLHPSGNPGNPEAIGTGESYLKALELSPRFNATPDASLYKNWGPDPIAFIKQIHSRITTLHFHDRKLNQTPQTWVPFGEGDVPTKELLLLAKREHYPFTFTIERIYNVPNIDHTAEIRRCVEYCKHVLDEKG